MEETNKINKTDIKKKKKGPYKFTEEKKKQWLDAFAEKHTVSAACKVVGINRNTAYKYREIDKEFREAWDEIENRMVDAVESALYKNALTGDNACIFFILCNRRPDRWKHRGEIAHTGKIQTEEVGRREQLLLLLKQDEDGKKFIEKWRTLFRNTEKGTG